MKIDFLTTQTTNPYLNLAYEEALLELADRKNRAFFMLWQNESTVVIGKNQNPWRECNVEALKNHNITLSRRITGGGAVYHDMGNLNFSFIFPNGKWDKARDFDIILEALSHFGIKGEVTGRNDMVAEGKKFSGNAYANKKNAFLHHGTLLVSSDMSVFPKYLSPSREKLKAKGVKSVSSRIINLCEFSADITVKGLIDTLFASAEKIIGAPNFVGDASQVTDKARVDEICIRNSSWEYVIGSTPGFEIEHTRKFEWGEITLMLNVKGGKITLASVYSDALLTDIITVGNRAIVGVPYKREDIFSAWIEYARNSEERDIVRDIASMIE